MDLPVNSKVSPSTISTTTLTSTITSTPTTTTTQPPITDDMADVVVVQKTRRVSHLLSWAKYVLIYLSIWQLILITCQLLLTIGSSFRRRSTLPMGHDRHFYWLNFALTIPLIVWWVWSITAIRRRDNLTIITLLGLFALIFILFDIIILGRMVTFGLSIAHGFNNHFYHIITHSEMLHHCLLPISRIICFTLWIHFITEQLSLTRWNHLEIGMKVNLASTDLNRLLNEFSN